VKAASDVTN